VCGAVWGGGGGGGVLGSLGKFGGVGKIPIGGLWPSVVFISCL